MVDVPKGAGIEADMPHHTMNPVTTTDAAIHEIPIATDNVKDEGPPKRRNTSGAQQLLKAYRQRVNQTTDPGTERERKDT